MFARIWLLLFLMTGQAMAERGNLLLPQRSVDPVVLEGSARNLQIFVGSRSACCTGKTPMAGRLTTERGKTTFTSAFGFVEGQVYTLRVDDALTEFSIPANDKAPQVMAIYPSGPDIPENTLRFYVHFATPMQPHAAGRYIRLVDDRGRTDDQAFMVFGQELWSADRKRLTLLMDPGRIKRGVSQNLNLGPALEMGRRYSIVIDAGWRSAIGGRQLPRFEQAFTITPPLRALPNTALWQITAPRQGTKDALTIGFDRPFDHVLAPDSITIANDQGQSIAGTVKVTRQETHWRFLPDKPWTGNRITLVVDPRLEDVAGNNFRDLLDHDLGTSRVSMQAIRVPVTLPRAP